MNSEEEAEYTITIEYNEFITRLDLDEILESIDRIIEAKLLVYFGIRDLADKPHSYIFPYWEHIKPKLTYLGIRSVSAGSITLDVVVSIAVLKYVAKRFKKGVDKSTLVDEFARSGQLTGDIIGSLDFGHFEGMKSR
jgi:hypothetical protein